MGIIEIDNPKRAAAGQLWVHSWRNLRQGDEAAPAELIFDEASFQVTGDFGGCYVSIEASLDGEEFGKLSGGSLAYTSDIKDHSVVQLAGPARLIRPRLIGASEATNLSVHVAVHA
jgi:hypothetical protein